MATLNNKSFFPILITSLALFLSGASFVSAASATTSPAFYKIFYYRESQKARDSFEANAKNIDVIAPQSYGVDADGDVVGGLDDEFIEIARQNNVKVMPLLTNSGFSQATIHKILDDTAVQDKIIKKLVAVGKLEGYWGWQFDFEQMTADYRDKYSAFVKRAYPEFKKNNLQFSVAVIAQYSLNPADYPNNLWQRVIGVYDYKALGANSDFLSIMSYDQPSSPGPVASLDWVKKIVRFSISQVPASKLSLGIPFYFWKWDAKTGKLVDIGSYNRIAELLESKKQIIKKGWNTTYQVAFVTYTQNKKKYTAWYEDAQSFTHKVELAQLYKMHGFSAWVLGLEDPKVHEVIQTQQM